MGVLQRRFQSSEFNENLMDNLDKTHFVIKVDNGQTLGFKGDSIVRHAEVVSGEDFMTMVVKIYGRRQAMIDALKLIFINVDGNYPI